MPGKPPLSDDEVCRLLCLPCGRTVSVEHVTDDDEDFDGETLVTLNTDPETSP